MNLEELLRTERVRVSGATAWLTYYHNEWVVFDRQPYARKNTTLYSGDDLTAAIDALRGSQS